MAYGELERTRETHADRSGNRGVVVGHTKVVGRRGKKEEL